MARKKGRRPAWEATRALHLALYPECRVCGEVKPSNHVHHLRYRGPRGSSEKPGDLVTLCEFHHNDLHRQWKRQSELGLVKFTLRFIADGRALVEAEWDAFLAGHR